MNQYLITTVAKGTTCPRCHSVILTGTAEGLPTRVDLTPLTPTGELQALLAGRRTYSLVRTELVERDASRIAGNRLAGPVLPAHHCGNPTPPEHHVKTSLVSHAATNPDVPPF